FNIIYKKSFFNIFAHLINPYSLTMALNGQAFKQAPHLIHFDWLILCGCLTVPSIAPTGQFLAHFVQTLQSSSLITIFFNALQTPAGHFLSLICAIYSSLKYLRVDKTGFGAVFPRPHNEPAFTTSASSSNLSKSSIVPLPLKIF